MADYNREILQALREIAVEMKGIRSELRGVKHAMQGIDRRLATSGGLTNALTRRAHLVEYDGEKFCSACGARIRIWATDPGETIEQISDACEYCGAIFSGEAVES